MLKYLFTTEYKDGTVFEQTPEDRSTTREGGSSYTDALALERRDEKLGTVGNPMTRFTLKGNNEEFSVNLIDGSFTCNGRRFQMHEQDLTKAGLRSIFFRNHTQTIMQGAESSKLLGDEIVYRFGWQFTMNGHNYQRVMQID